MYISELQLKSKLFLPINIYFSHSCALLFIYADYDAISNNLIESTFGPTAHYDEKAATSMVDSLNVRIYNNRTVEIIDIRGRPPSFHVVSEHELHCFLQTGMPGGTVNVFAVY